MKFKQLSLLAILIIGSTALQAQQKVKSLPPAKPVVGEIGSFTLPEGYVESLNLDGEQRPAVTYTHGMLKRENVDLNNGLNIVTRDSKNRPLLIEAGQGYKQLHGKSMGEQAKHFVEQASQLLGISNAGQAFELVRQDIDEIGMQHIKMQQMYQGVPVYGGEIIIHGDQTGLKSLNGFYHSQPKDINTVASIAQNTSEQTLVDRVGIADDVVDDFGLFDFEKLKTELVVFTKEDGSQHLAYHHTIYRSLVDRWEYFVDAHTGDVLDSHSSICKFHHHDSSDEVLDVHVGCSHHHHAHDHNKTVESTAAPQDGPVQSTARDLFGANKDINTYNVGSSFYMIDASRSMFSNQSNMPNEPVGTIWTIDAFNTSVENSNFMYDHVKSNSSSFPNKETAVSAHVNGGIAYEYFKNVHSRESINGMGGNIVSLINIVDRNGNSFDNAFWNGQAMFYGNGNTAFRPLARGLDVAGHEMTHGVVQATANLTYQGESGALNESMADVFGAMMDRADWQIGEDVVKNSAFPSGALRDLMDPHNGAQTGDFNRGWQPKHMNEKFTGSQDNGGVHINSGIPNHAFYRFAIAVGRDKAEKVYYRALTRYLTKSSQFADARIAVVKAASDLYGDAEVNAAKDAWSAVGVGESSGGNYENDSEVNPGQDLIVVADSDRNKLVLLNGNGEIIANPLSDIGPLSKPSVSDDGSKIVYVGKDNRIYLIEINWTEATFSRSTFQSDQVWRNAVISKDGRRFAVTTTDNDNRIIVYDAVIDSQTDFNLYNPTFTQGVSAGDVVVSDAMEFDFSGDNILYDALNRLEGNNGNIEFWDIGIINVWSSASESFALGEVQKIFTGLAEGESIGNPTYSKNSDYIIAFDFIENSSAGTKYQLLGANIERGSVKVLFENLNLSYPSYSRSDDKVIHDINIGGLALGVLDVDDSKINPVANSQDILINGARWGVWFSNGEREIVGLDEVVAEGKQFDIVPNPTTGMAQVIVDMDAAGAAQMVVSTLDGKVVLSQATALASGFNRLSIDVSNLSSGAYILSLKTDQGISSRKLVVAK